MFEARPVWALLVPLVLLTLVGCPKGGPGTDGGLPDSGSGVDGGQDSGPPAGDAGPLPHLSSALVNSRFNVAEHMRASREMQVSGEPFAQILNYNLNNFNRQLRLTDQYTDPLTGIQRTDPLGYALAIESYEYSKQPMNQLSFESGAGLSLMYGPVLNPLQQSGDAGYQLLADRFQHFAAASFSGGTAGANLIISPAPSGNPLNFYGWPGFWPVFAEFSSFDPTIQPAPGSVNTCTFKGAVGSFGYGTGHHGTLIANYECDYNSLNLPQRDTQVTKTLGPDALGYVVWKQGLWTINYWQSLNDTAGNGITSVAPSDLPSVGQPGNTVVGQFPDPTDPTGVRMLSGAAGVYLGDIPMEGWQGLTMIEEIDNKAALLLGSLISTDGLALGGVSSIQAAINYSYDSPLVYFPSLVSATETATTAVPGYTTKYFPKPTAFTIASADSHLASLNGLVGGFGEAFSMTDPNNSQVGGSVPFLASFDGDPFAHDDGLPDGESTLHDRALGVLKIALVNLDRLHFDPTAKVLVDTATVSAGVVTRGTTVNTRELAESIVSLRNAYRALNGTLQLYSNDTPDTLGGAAALDSAPLTGAPYSGTLQAHLIDLVRAQADFLSAKLIDANGAVANGYDLSLQVPDGNPTDLEAEAAAVRGMLDAYLATSNGAYRTRAIQVFADLQKRFWMSDIEAFRTTAGVDNVMKYTPARHGALQGALRQYYKLVASDPSRHAEGVLVLHQIKRSNKLVVNGWNDMNRDDVVQYPDECLSRDGGVSGIQMGERALTAELGNPGDVGDRDKDCVKEISFVGLPAALGAELEITRQ